MPDAAAIARRFVETLETRDWEAWAALLHPDVRYVVPQTGERITGRDRYLRFNATFPGDWHLAPKVVIGDHERAVVWFVWREGDGATADAQVFLEVDADGMVTEVTDFWPEPYEPPERADPSVFDPRG